MPASYQISVLSSGTWIIPSGAPSPDAPADLVYTLDGINGPGLKPNSPSQNITGTILLEWIPVTAPIQAKITIPKEALFNADRTQLQKAWEQFKANLDGQEGINQYMLPGGARITGSLLSQNMPMQVLEIPYYRLGFSPLSTNYYIDLQPGFRLLLANGNFYNETHAGIGQQMQNFSATGISYADIQSDTDSNALLFNAFMSLQKVAIQPPANLSTSNVRIASSILDLAAQPLKPYHRVFYPNGNFTGNDVASLSVTDSVCLESTYCYGSLGTDSGKLPTDEICDPLKPKIYPTVFFGRCSLVIQLPVTINGRATYVSAGTTIQNILETARPGNSQPRMLRITRYLNAQKATILYPAGNTTAVMNMPVLQGDEVSWLPLGNFQLTERLQAIYRITNPSPDATDLGKLGIQSFGAIPTYNLPVADDMAQALLASHETPAPYTAPQIGIALFSIYNSTPYTDPYGGDQLAYSLYFAGFDVINVSLGVVAGYTPVITMQTGGILVAFLLKAGIGYPISAIADGVYQSLDSSTATNGYYLVQSLIEGSNQYGRSYQPSEVAEGTYHAVGYTVTNGFTLAADLMQGSSMAAPAKQEYVSTITGPALFYAYSTNSITLTQNDLAMALAKAFFGQPLAYPVDQVALGVFIVYPDSDATIIATALTLSGVNYTMNDVAKGTYAVKNYDPAPGHILSTEELALALFTAYGSTAVNTPVNVAVALVYAIGATVTSPNLVAAAVAKAFGYQNAAHQYTQDHVNAIGTAVTTAFKLSGTLQSDVNSTAVALLYAFEDLTATQMASGLVAGFLYPVSGTDSAGMFAVCLALINAYGYDKSSQAQVNTTGAALQNAFQANMQDQACATTVAKSLVNGFSGILPLTLVTAMVQTGSYVSTKGGDVTLVTQASGTALSYNAQDQSQLNILCVSVKTAMAIDAVVQAGVNYLSQAMTVLNGNAVVSVNNGIALKTAFAYSGAVQGDVNHLANAIVYAYGYVGNKQDNVNDLTSVVVTSFTLDKNTVAQITIAGNAQISCFGFTAGNQGNINSSAAGLVTAFGYSGFNTYGYLKSDARLIGLGLQGIFSPLTIQQLLPALRSGFPLFLPVDASYILTDLYQLGTNSKTDLATLGNLVGTNYQLSTQPYGVASVSLLLFAPGYSFINASGWIGPWYTGWTADDFTIFNNVYNTPIWTQSLVAINARQTAQAMATGLQTAYDPNHSLANEMVQILAACYYYLDLNISLTPVGTAMKNAGYSLVQTSGAMGSGQYQAQWTPEFYMQLVKIFNGN